jgi:hypothetical protein
LRLSASLWLLTYIYDLLELRGKPAEVIYS